jgi:pimeloyl-ACP methyl ester carboxylesterase
MRLFPATVCLFFALTVQPLWAEQANLPHQDLTLNAELKTVGEDWTTGPVVLMTHGTLAHNGMEIIRGLQNMLADRGVSSLALNLSLGLDKRPSAMYDCATPHTHKHTDALDEIGAWLAWLKEKGVKQVALLGHSRGGNQTAWFAAERPDPAVVHAFLITPSVWAEESAAKDHEKRYGNSPTPMLNQARELVAAGKPGQILSPVDFLYCKQTGAAAEAVVSYYSLAPQFDSTNLIPRIQSPVTVFAGTEDRVNERLIEKMEPLADGERVQLEIIEGADHFFRDLYSEDVADVIAETLEQ